MMQTVHISLSPNLQIDDLILTFKTLFNPFLWRNKIYQKKLIKQLENLYPHSKVYLTNSARSALLLALKAIQLPPNSNILLQSFTCSALVNPILANRIKPEYLDISLSTLNPDYLEFKNKINSATRAILVQHTFGNPNDLQPLLDLSRQKKILLIEDCAHSLGARYKKKFVGSYGDFSILSFGRDKIISSVFGGALIVNNKALFNKIDSQYAALPSPSLTWTIQQLLHPPITYLAKLTYSLQLGKLILLISQKLNIISKAIYKQEKLHHIPPIFPARLPEPLARLAYNQLNKLDYFNITRQKIATYYHKHISNPKITKPKFNPDAIYLRYNILLETPKSLEEYLKANNIICGDWYRQPITPSLNLSLAKYKLGQNKNTEIACRQSLNLPTAPTMTMEQVKKIVTLVNSWS